MKSKAENLQVVTPRPARHACRQAGVPEEEVFFFWFQAFS